MSRGFADGEESRRGRILMFLRTTSLESLSRERERRMRLSSARRLSTERLRDRLLRNRLRSRRLDDRLRLRRRLRDLDRSR